MGLSGTTMGDDIAAAIKTAGSSITPGTPVTDDQLKTVWEAAATALVNRVKTDGIVLPTTLTSPSGAVTGAGTIT